MKMRVLGLRAFGAREALQRKPEIRKKLGRGEGAPAKKAMMEVVILSGAESDIDEIYAARGEGSAPKTGAPTSADAMRRTRRFIPRG
jgi:hypothetical protein